MGIPFGVMTKDSDVLRWMAAELRILKRRLQAVEANITASNTAICVEPHIMCSLTPQGRESILGSQQHIVEQVDVHMPTAFRESLLNVETGGKLVCVIEPLTTSGSDPSRQGEPVGTTMCSFIGGPPGPGPDPPELGPPGRGRIPPLTMGPQGGTRAVMGSGRSRKSAIQHCCTSPTDGEPEKGQHRTTTPKDGKISGGWAPVPVRCWAPEPADPSRQGGRIGYSAEQCGTTCCVHAYRPFGSLLARRTSRRAREGSAQNNFAHRWLSTW